MSSVDELIRKVKSISLPEYRKSQILILSDAAETLRTLQEQNSELTDKVVELEADVAILNNNNEALERDDKILRDHIEELEAANAELKKRMSHE
jgi:peptidoglycan hydrolase CwlO-like protein